MSATTIVRESPTAEPLAASPAKPAPLKPKEHGAYAILGIPIATSLLIAGASLPGVCVAIAAIAGFLAHEPLLVLWGRRGARAKRSTPTATKHLSILLLMTLAGGTTALLLGSPALRWSLLACVLLAATSFGLAIAGKHRTFVGQLWGIVGLSVPCLPILIAGGLAVSTSVEIWTTWLIGFTSTTLAVRSVIAAQKRHPRLFHGIAIAALTVLVAALAALGQSLAVIALPMLAMSWFLFYRPPAAKHLRRVGWTLVVGTLVSAVWMIAATGSSAVVVGG